ncbi:hypothetical protein PGB90_001693 [Kerria lacca]
MIGISSKTSKERERRKKKVKKLSNCTNLASNISLDELPLLIDNCTLKNTISYKSDRFESFLYEVPSAIIILLSVFYGTISIVAVIGNFLVIWIVTTSRRMQNVTNCFIANLALADIVIGLFAIPFQFQAALLQRWNLPHFMCPFCPFVQVLSVTVSIFTLTAIAMDRHKAILNPLRAYPSKYRAKICIVCIWTVAFFIALPMAIALRVEIVEYTDSADVVHTKPFCHNTELPNDLMLSYRLLILFVQYIVPLCIISCVYARMALRLWGSHAPGNAQFIRDATLMKNKKKEKFKREFQQRFPFKSRKWRFSTRESLETDRTLVGGRLSLRSTTTTIERERDRRTNNSNGYYFANSARTNKKFYQHQEKDTYVLQSSHGNTLVHCPSESEYDELCL